MCRLNIGSTMEERLEVIPVSLDWLCDVMLNRLGVAEDNGKSGWEAAVRNYNSSAYMLWSRQT